MTSSYLCLVTFTGLNRTTMLTAAPPVLAVRASLTGIRLCKPFVEQVTIGSSVPIRRPMIGTCRVSCGPAS